jgi:hypothetical protein
MLKKIPITLAAVSVVQGLRLHADEETNVQLDEDSEWNASIAQAKPSSSSTVEISADEQSHKKHKKKHHKSKKHQKKNDDELIQSASDPKFNATVTNFNVTTLGD